MFDKTTKLSLLDVIFAVVTPVPAMSIKTFSLVVDAFELETSSRISSNDVTSLAWVIRIPPSFNAADPVSPHQLYYLTSTSDSMPRSL